MSYAIATAPVGRSSSASTAEGDKAMAYAMCQDFVKQRLKAPSTADFPWSYDDKVAELGGGRWQVRGYVDAQNGFGAQIRSNFVCTVVDGGESWTLEKMVMD